MKSYRCGEVLLLTEMSSMVNPLHPNIKIHILLSVPFTFSLLLMRQMFLNDPVLLEFSMISLVYFHCLM